MSELSKIEQETIITYNRKEDFVEIATRIPRDLNKLKKLGKVGEAELIDEASGYVCYTMPKRNFTWNRKRRPAPITEEKKAELVERLQKAREAKTFPTAV